MHRRTRPVSCIRDPKASFLPGTPRSLSLLHGQIVSFSIMNKIAFGLAAGLFFLAGCSTKEEGTPVIARVGDAKLTLSDLQESIPPEYLPFMTRQQYQEYVEHWMESEILYNEAEKRKLDSNAAVRLQIQKARRDILVSQLINQLCPPSEDVSDLQVQRYYEEHRSEFIRTQWEIKSLHMLIPDQKVAWAVRQQITDDAGFLDLARKHSIDPVDDPQKIRYVEADKMLPELAGVILGIRVGGTTNPIQTAKGNYIFRIVDKQAPKSIRPLSEVRDEIINRLAAEKQKQQVQDLVAKLKTGLVVRINLAEIPGPDSGKIAAQTPDSMEILP